MTSDNNYKMFDFAEILRDYPDFMSSKDLVDLGLFNSYAQLYHSRKTGKGPKFFKIGSSIRYPKNELIKFLEERF